MQSNPERDSHGVVHTRAINWLLLFRKCSLWHSNIHLLPASHSLVYHYWFGLFWESLTHKIRLISKPIWINFFHKITWNTGKCFPKIRIPYIFLYFLTSLPFTLPRIKYQYWPENGSFVLYSYGWFTYWNIIG